MDAVTSGPDDGWDYSGCEDPTDGVRRAVAARSGKLPGPLGEVLRAQADDVHAAWPVRGLARRFPARDLATLQTLLKRYADLFPEELPHGVKFVREGGPSDDFYMATDGQGGFYFREIEHAGFNSRRDLFGGLAKCASGQPMAREEEYALECLWHEIWHNRQKGGASVMAYAQEHPARRFAETLNQAVARLTYPRFVERMGGQAQHQDWVLENGFGYATTVSRLWKVLDECGVSRKSLAGDLSSINREGDLSEAVILVARLLAKRGKYSMPRIHAALELLSSTEDRFLARLGEIKSEFSKLNLT